jgi:hypothetical protein
MLKKDVLKELIADFHSEGLPETRKRQLQVPLDTGKIVTLSGVRRCGKTFLLFESIKVLLARRVPVRRILYINFEDERLTLSSDDLDLILQAYRELYPDLSLKDCYFFFDEIQNVPAWEKFIRRVYDTVTKNIFITGSNSHFLGSEIATSLRGRVITHEVFPLSFKEYLWFHDAPGSPRSSANRAKIAHHLGCYLTEGGFPELPAINDVSLKNKVLQEYFNVMLYRDLIERYSITNLPVLRYFVRRVLESVTTPVSSNKIFNELKSQGYHVGKNTLYEFLDATEAIYLFQIVKKYNPSVLKQDLGEKKAYVIDNGLLNAVTFKFSKDYGKLLENSVYLDLRMKGLLPFFYKDRRECDFIIQDRSGNLHAVQVAYSIDDPDTARREIAGLLDVCRRLKIDRGTIVTFGEEDLLHEGDVTIKVLPAYKFFLGDMGMNS